MLGVAAVATAQSKRFSFLRSNALDKIDPLFTTSTTAFDAFAAEARGQGFDEVVERNWEPSTAVESHTHPFSVRALVVRGDMCLTIGDDVRHLQPGDEFVIDRDVPHSERYGSEGATYWAARRRS